MHWKRHVTDLRHPRHVVILGAGAMGCLFGGLLKEGRLNVTLVDIWKEHVDAINRHGLLMVGFGGERAIPVRATTDVASVPPADIVSVHCKAAQTPEAVTSAVSLFHEGTVAISFQNGIGNEEAIGGIVGSDRVLGGWTAMGASIVRPGVVRNYGEQLTQVGEMEGGVSDRARAIAGAFSVPGLPTEASGDIVGGMWKKLLANVGLSAPSAITNLPISDAASVPELRAVIDQAVDEAAAVANAAGIRIDASETLRILDRLVGEGGTGANKASLCIDVINERRTEIDVINGVIVRLGRKLGVPTPVNEVFVAAVKGLEWKYLTRSSGS